MIKCYNPKQETPDSICVWTCPYSTWELGSDRKCNYENLSRKEKIEKVFGEIDDLYSESGHVDMSEIKKTLLMMVGLLYDS